jgi:hypothetical protein
MEPERVVDSEFELEFELVELDPQAARPRPATTAELTPMMFRN